MIAETVLCNSGRSLSRRTAHVYPVRLDASAREERIHIEWQFVGIKETIKEVESDCMLSMGAGIGLINIKSLVFSAHEAFAEGRYDVAVTDLEQIAREAKTNSDNFDGCPTDPNRNYVGNFMSRGLIAAFTIFDRFIHPLSTGEGGNWVVYPVPADLDVF